jgi:hypothetical protein
MVESHLHDFANVSELIPALLPLPPILEGICKLAINETDCSLPLLK